MDIIYVPIKDLSPASYNPRQIKENDFKHLKDGLNEFDFVEPIVVNSNKDRKNTIIGGHQRIKAAEALGLKTVPVFYIDLTEDKERKLNIKLNKNTGDWDWDILENEFEIADLIDFGFEEKDFLGVDILELPELPDGDKEEYQNMTFTLHDEQVEIITSAIEKYKKGDEFKCLETFGNESSNGNALYGLITGK